MKFKLYLLITCVFFISIQVYKSDLAQPSVLLAEVERWRYKWQNAEPEQPENAIATLPHCNIDLFPNIRRLIQIMATLPVSTATAERSFSTLRRLKTYMRSSMLEDRLTGLALIAIHRERHISVKKVIDTMCLVPRRSDFIL